MLQDASSLTKSFESPTRKRCDMEVSPPNSWLCVGLTRGPGLNQCSRASLETRDQQADADGPKPTHRETQRIDGGTPWVQKVPLESWIAPTLTPRRSRGLRLQEAGAIEPLSGWLASRTKSAIFWRSLGTPHRSFVLSTVGSPVRLGQLPARLITHMYPGPGPRAPKMARCVGPASPQSQTGPDLRLARTTRRPPFERRPVEASAD